MRGAQKAKCVLLLFQESAENVGARGVCIKSALVME
jgi:hypothetical protein